MEPSFLASAGKMLWRYLSAHNIDADALFQRYGLNPASIREPRARYPFKSLCKALIEAAVLTHNEYIGLHLAKHFSPLDLNALGVTFLSSESLFESFRRVLRYEAIVNSSLLLSIEESKNRLDLICEVPALSVDAIRIIEDTRSAVLIGLCRTALNNAVDPIEIAFTYPQPKSTAEYFGVFRCPLLFSQPVWKISFDIADAQRLFTTTNDELATSNDQILDNMLAELSQSTIVSQVRRAIIDGLPSGNVHEDEIAKRVFVSSRTLQRRLAEENTNFRKLLLDVRRELAEKYIADKSIPLAEISYLLGFADTSSFSRAFKQWTGGPPTLYRNNLLR